MREFKKMVGVGGVDKERSDEEPEQSEGNLVLVSNPIFARAKNEQKQKEKATAGQIIFAQADACFFAGD